MMNKDELVIGLDCSTTGTKALAFDRKGKVLGPKAYIGGVASCLDFAYAAFGRLGSTTFLSVRVGF
jgi:N-acetylglucosamine kinase-like BadF-type ATPase